MRFALIAVIFLGAALCPAGSAKSPPPNLQQQTIFVPEDQRDAPCVLTPGSRIAVTLDDQMRIATLLAIKEEADQPAAPESVLFALSYEDGATILEVRNGLSKTITYAAALVKGDPKQGRWQSTSICPVTPGLMGMEMWPGRVDGIAIIKIMEPPGGDMSCVDASKFLKSAPKPKAD